MTSERCSRCGTEFQATNKLAQRAHAEGLCSDCWLDVPADEGAADSHETGASSPVKPSAETKGGEGDPA